MRPESNAPLVAVTLTEFVCGLNRMRTRSIRHFWIVFIYYNYYIRLVKDFYTLLSRSRYSFYEVGARVLVKLVAILFAYIEILIIILSYI